MFNFYTNIVGTITLTLRTIACVYTISILKVPGLVENFVRKKTFFYVIIIKVP